jgi:hypothetical protein
VAKAEEQQAEAALQANYEKTRDVFEGMSERMDVKAVYIEATPAGDAP